MNELIIIFASKFVVAGSGFVLGVYLGKKDLEKAAKEVAAELKKEGGEV